MKTLFIDTHSETVTTILKVESDIFIEETKGDRSHSEVTMPTLKRLIDKSGITLRDIDEVIVVIGPGSFTGVRIGVTIAKTIAYDTKKPIKTISSLEMYGESAKEDFDLVTVEDSKGIYSAHLKNGKYEDFKYQKRSEFDDYVLKNGYKVLKEKRIDIDKIIEYLFSSKPVNPHKVNPIYIKEIDVLK